jgi:hypothetical protein
MLALWVDERFEEKRVNGTIFAAGSDRPLSAAPEAS